MTAILFPIITMAVWFYRNLTPTPLIIVMVSMICVFIAHIFITKHILPNNYLVPVLTAIACTVICACISIHSFTVYYTAQNHGLKNTNISVYEMEKSNKNSPVEDTLPENIKNSIIIYYKYGCTDCEAVYNDLLKTIKNNDNIYFVSTESEQGKNLLKSYPVNSVPAGIYIYEQNNQTAKAYIQKSLYMTDNSKTTLDKTALERLLYLQEQKR